jgi:hypothetical protein
MEIQHLYSLKQQVHAHHRETYFPFNMTQFLQTSTILQLRTYITNYKPAIFQSIQSAKRLHSKTKNIHQYHGFTHTARQMPTHQSSTTLPSRTEQPTRPIILQQTLFPHLTCLTNTSHNPYISRHQHQRHTRWKSHNRTTTPTPPTYSTSRSKRETHPRKHSRCWKATKSTQDRFKAFFSHNPRTSPTTHPNV